MNTFGVAQGAIIEDNVSVGEETKVWYFSHVCRGAKIGRNCNIGEGVYVGENVIIGDNVRIANRASIYRGAVIKDDVFIGAHTVITNVRKPRAYKRARKIEDTIIGQGATIGAGVVIVAGVKIGEKSIIADGSVVINNIEPHRFVAGNPAREPRGKHVVRNDEEHFIRNTVL